MKKVLFVLVLGLSVSFANPMPKGASGYKEAQNIISAVSGYEVDCVSGQNSLSVGLNSHDVVCAQVDIDQTIARFAIDQAMSDYEDTGAWKLIDGHNDITRFVRIWTLGDGTLSVVIRPSGATEITYYELRYLYR